MKGKLILFTSYAPGAGKTFHMLSYANSLAQQCSVHYGYIYHQLSRAFTQEYQKNNRPLPRFQANLDMEGIISMRPDYVVVDELTFWNLRTKKRLYQDIEILLDCGISVISSCNLRVFKRVNQRCEKVSNIRFRNTIPDNYFENISEIHFIDIDEQKLQDRYIAGKLFKKKTKLLDRYFDISVLQEYRKIALEELKKYEREYPHITIFSERVCK